MHLSQLPISFPELTISSPGASASVVIPTLNGAMNLPWVIRRLPSHVDEVVVPGGRSHDHTADRDIIVMLDADGSVDPREIGRFVSPLQHDYDFAKCSRYATGGGSEDLTWLRNAGNRALTVVANIVFRSDYSDLCYGYIAFRRECLEVLNWLPRPPATCAGLGSLTSLQPS